MTELKELFKEREEAVNRLSDQIFDSIPNVIDGCVQFIKEKGADEDQLEWEGVHYDEDRDVVLLLGNVTYKPGDTVKLPNGEEMVVNDNTAPYFQAMLRLAIPYKIVVEGTIEDVYEFLKSTVEYEEEEHVEVQRGDLESIGSASEFDLDELTEEQKKQLEMFTSQPTEKKNN